MALSHTIYRKVSLHLLGTLDETNTYMYLTTYTQEYMHVCISMPHHLLLEPTIGLISVRFNLILNFDEAD